MNNYRNILLAINFDEEAPQLLKRAVQRARIEGAALSIIHVDQSVNSTLFEGFMDLDTLCGHEDEEFFKESISNMKELVAQSDYPIKNRLICSGELGDEISSIVQSYEIDLLIMGHHVSSRFRQLFIAACEPLVRKMPCDLLLLRL
ncbi:Universal stress protein A [invertebrate metagenome]|uniref:Universal stress protein A n=1 Tax=invertebrate metagenome TaxID=1711999 RepID=A0A2H9T595_9ZZZZ